MTTLETTSPESTSTAPAGGTKSSTALWLGILFSLAFTALIRLLGSSLPQVDFLPDTGYAWYYWQLPEPTFWSRASVWVLYVAHQVSLWGLIWYGQRQKLKYTGGLHRLNWVALGVNALFITLHLIQSHIWYDGLAQDVSIFSSQGSVILMLILILLMENQRRGLFFGRKVGFLKETAGIVRRYHGYIFAWAVVYTFWYHPMEASTGHLIGFLYTFFLMLQGSLMFTRAHLNRWWTFALEIIVLAHGTLVAIATNTMWPMFFFGFAAIFIVTQMWGLGLNKWWRWGFIAAYVAGVVLVYNGRGWANLNEIARIPAIEYALVFAAALIIWLILRLIALISRAIGRAQPPAATGL